MSCCGGTFGCVALEATFLYEAEAVLMARVLMCHWSLDDWEFRINRRRRALGMCFVESKRIELSQVYIRNNDSEHVRDTILHEIAHALAPGHGHDQIWLDTVMIIGGRAKVKCSDAIMPPGSWQAECPNCRKLFSQLRKPKWGDAFHCLGCGEEKGALLFERVAATARVIQSAQDIERMESAERVLAAERVESVERVLAAERMKSAERVLAAERGESVERALAAERVESVERALAAKRVESVEGVLAER